MLQHFQYSKLKEYLHTWADETTKASTWLPETLPMYKYNYRTSLNFNFQDKELDIEARSPSNTSSCSE